MRLDCRLKHAEVETIQPLALDPRGLSLDCPSRTILSEIVATLASDLARNRVFMQEQSQ